MALARCRAERPCRWELDVADDKVEEFEQRHRVSSPSHADEMPTDIVCDDVVERHGSEFDTVVRIIEAVGGENAGRVNPNHVRVRIPSHITPQVISATYNVLLRRGRLVKTGEKVPNTDRKGRNTNKECNVFRVVGP